MDMEAEAPASLLFICFIKDGGYYYAYEAVPPARVKRELARCIEDWHESLLDSLSRFEEEMEASLD